MIATDYLMVLPVRQFRTGEGVVSVESAFAEHLRVMRNHIGPDLRRLVVASPGMSEATYALQSPTMSTIYEIEEGISFCTLFQDGSNGSLRSKALTFVSVMSAIHASVVRSACVHSGLSWDLRLPFESVAIMFGVLLRRRTVFVVDIDYRHSAQMSHRTGELSRKSYLVSRYVYNKLHSVQVMLAVRFCTVVLLKSRQMVADFGRNRPNVHSFLDASHSAENIIGYCCLREKVSLLKEETRPLRLVYFGRLTAYKGVDRCIQAVAMAQQSGANVQLDIIGSGSQLDALRKVSAGCNADAFVNFIDGQPFDQEFFELLYRYHVLLAAPLREDTPRNALDAMAAGMAFVAFDTYYYRELLESGAGKTVAWLDVEAMAETIVELDRNRTAVVAMIERAVEYARQNTQKTWLDRRQAWTLSATAG